MKKIKTKFITVILISLVLFQVFSFHREVPPIKSSEEEEDLKISGTEVDYEIKINGKGEKSEWGFLTWEQAAAQYGFSGTGTENDPYIIESFIWKPSTWIDCIHIMDSDKHFIIRDCEFHNAYEGIRLR